MKLNEDKNIHSTFTNKRYHHISVIMNAKTIHHTHTAKYLGMMLDTIPALDVVRQQLPALPAERSVF